MSANKLLENLKRDQNKKSRTKRIVMKEEGKYNLRFLPNKSDPNGLPYERVFLHFGFNHPNFNNPSTFRCAGKNCPLCAKAKEMKEAGDQSAWRFKSTPVFLYYASDANGNFRFVRLSNSAHSEVLGELTSMAQSGVNPLDLENGRVAQLKLSKEGNKNKWKCSFLNEVSKVAADVQTELKMAPELADVYRNYTHEELGRIARGEKLDFKGGRSEAAEEEEEQEEQGSRPMTRSAVSDDESDKPKAPVSEESAEDRKARIRRQLEEDDT